MVNTSQRDQAIEYWLSSSADDLDTSEKLFLAEKYNHCLFFAHLAVEKIIKGAIIRDTDRSPLPLHDLIRLIKQLNIVMSETELIELKEINSFNLRARYDSYKKEFYHKATKAYAKKWMTTSKKWLSKLTKDGNDEK